jgi:hypothetical protein
MLNPIELALRSTMLLVGITRDHEFHRLHNLAKSTGDDDRHVVKIGRLSTADLVMDDQRVKCLLSREHAEIALERGRAELRDLGSTNGTYVMRPGADAMTKLGRDVPWILRDGDVIGFGAPEMVNVNSAQQDEYANNPFLFVYREMSEPSTSSPEGGSNPTTAGSGSRRRASASASACGKRKAAAMDGDFELVDDHLTCAAMDGDFELVDDHLTCAAMDGDVELVNNHLTCSVCLDMFVRPRTLGCAHTFCATCIGSFNALSCPMCRKPIDSQPRPAIALEGVVATIAKQHLDGAANADRRRKEWEWAIIEKAVDKRIRMNAEAKNETRRKRVMAHLTSLLALVNDDDDSAANADSDNEVTM